MAENVPSEHGTTMEAAPSRPPSYAEKCRPARRLRHLIFAVAAGTPMVLACPTRTYSTPVTHFDGLDAIHTTPTTIAMLSMDVQASSQSPRFVDNGDGTITDTQTNLTWEKKLAGAGCLHCVEDFYPWEPGLATSENSSAFDWLSKVNSEPGEVQPGLGGHSDWRLPSRDELRSLVDCSFGATCIDPSFGPTFTDAPYWTFTTLGDQPTHAWEIGFHLGLVYDAPKNFNGQVRAVRGGTPVQLPGGTPPRFIDNFDGTVTDAETGLMWEQKVAGSGCPRCVNDRYAWEPGLALSGHPSMFDWLSQLNGYFIGTGPAQPGFAGYSDWRIPSRDELGTLVYCASGPPCVDPVVGTTGTVVPYFTSTSLGQNPAHAWLIGFGAGHVTDGPKDVTAYVRAVRGGVFVIAPSPTPTPTATPQTPSHTFTATFTRTATGTPTDTLTPTTAPTFTPTYTATLTFTATHTPLPTGTDTATPSVTATATSTVTSSKTATQTPTPTPRVVHIDIGSGIGGPGDTIPIVVSIATAEVVVAGTGNDITFGIPQLSLDPASCHANPVLGKTLVASVVHTDAATQTVRVFIQSGVNTAPIQDGPLYTCEVRISPSTTPGDYLLLSNNNLAFSDTGAQIDLVAGSNGLVAVSLVPPTSAPTAVPTGMPTHTVIPISPTSTETETQSLTTPTVPPAPTETPPPASTPTAIQIPCVGDCGGRGVLTISDLITGVDIVLGTLPVSACPAFENAQGTVDIAQLIRGVSNALNGCGNR